MNHKCSCQKNKLDFEIKMAFQPIVNIKTKKIVSYEALVRGANGEGAYQVLKKVNDENKYSFDQECRIKAIKTFSQLETDPNCSLNINFMPQAIYEPNACLTKTIQVSKLCNFDINRIIFEITEQEKVMDKDFLINIFSAYREKGLQTAIDDFGEGYAGLNLLSGFQPDYIKLDMNLVRDIDTDNVKQSIFKGIKVMCNELNVKLLAEGVETENEYLYLNYNGVELMQGYYFAKPEIEALPKVDIKKFK